MKDVKRLREKFWKIAEKMYVDEYVAKMRYMVDTVFEQLEREESDRMDKIRLFAESRKKIAEKELDKLGYFDDWYKVNELIRYIVLAYKLGVWDGMHSLMGELLKVLDEEEKERGGEE